MCSYNTRQSFGKTNLTSVLHWLAKGQNEVTVMSLAGFLLLSQDHRLLTAASLTQPAVSKTSVFWLQDAVSEHIKKKIIHHYWEKNNR